LSDETPEQPSPEAAKKRRRWPWLLLLLLACLTAAHVLLRTDAGLELIRRAALSIAQPSLRGTLSIDSIRGDLFSEVRIEGLVLHDAEARPAVSLRALDLRWRPAALLSGTVHIEHIELDVPEVLAVTSTAGVLNLSELTVPSTAAPEDDSGPPLPLSLPTIQLDRLQINSGSFVMKDAQGAVTANASDLTLRCALDAAQERMELRIEDLSASLMQQYNLRTEATLRLDGTQAEVEDLIISTEGARLRVPRLRTEVPPGRLEGQVDLLVDRGAAAKLGAPSQLQGGAQLTLDVRRPADAATWSLDGRGQLAEAPLALSATVSEDLGVLQVKLQALGFNPRRLHTEAPSGRLNLELRADGDLSNPLALLANADARITGEVSPPGQAPLRIDPLQVRAHLEHDIADVHVTGRVASARLDAKAQIAQVLSEPIIHAAHAEVVLPDLRRLLGDSARGRLTLTATASGPLDDLSAEGLLQAQGLRYTTLASVRGLQAQWALQGLPSNPVGAFDLEVGASQVQGRPIDGLSVALRAQQVDKNTELHLSTFNLTTGGIVWRGGGAHLTLEPQGGLQVENLGLLSLAGNLAIDARIAAPGPAQGNLDLDVNLEDLNLSALPRSLLPELGSVAGRLDLKARVQRRGRRITGQVRTQGRGLRAKPKHAPVDIEALVQLAPQDLTLTATVGSDAIGYAVLQTHTRPPKSMHRPDAWQRAVVRAPVQSAQVLLRGLQLQELQTLTGQQVLSEGQLDGRVHIDTPKNQARLALSVSKLRSPDVNLDGSVRIRAGFDAGTVWTHGVVHASPLGDGTFTATVAGPPRLFDPQGWAKLGPDAVIGARVDLDELKLTALSRLDLVQGLEGDVDLHLRAGPRAVPLSLEVRARQVHLPWVSGLWAGQSTLKLEASHVAHVLSASLDGRTVVSSRLQAPLSLAVLLKSSPADLQRLPIALNAAIDAFPLKPLCQPMGLDPCILTGALTAAISASGTADAPKALLDANLTGLGLADTRFTVASASVSLDRGVVQAGLRVVDETKGQITVTAQATDKGEDLSARVLAHGLELDSVSRLGLLPVGLKGDLFADLMLEQVGQRPQTKGWAEIRDLRVAFAQAALQPLHDGKARVELRGDAATVELDGASGGGTLKVRADASFGPDAPPKFKATTTLQAFPVAAGALVRIDLNAEAEGKVQPDATHVQVVLTDGFVHVPQEETESLHAIEELEDVVYVDRLPGGTGGKKTETASVTAGPPTIITIKTAHPLDVRGGPVDAAFVTDLVAKSSASGSGLRGRVFTSEGAITLFRRRYIIERAELVFDGRDPPNPRVDVRLRHEFSDLSFQVIIRGTAEAPDLEFRGSPARFSQTELLTIFMGTDPQDLGKDDNRTMEQQAVGAVAGFLVGKLQDELGKALPIDTLDVELGDTSAGGAGTRVTLGKWITRKLFLAYRYKFEADTEHENDNEAVVQYRFLPGWMVEVVLGLTRNDADLFWTKRF